MRLDHEVTFWADDEEYNPQTHQYGDVKKVATAVASVTDMGTDKSVQQTSNQFIHAFDLHIVANTSFTHFVSPTINVSF